MRCYSMSLALVVGLMAGPAALADEAPAGKVDPARIAKLVDQLGSPKFLVRNHARQQLKAIGEPALEALRKATTSTDAERSRVATELVKGIEAKLLTAKLLAPKRVKLDLDDRPVLDAVNELARQGGYPIQVVGDRNSLARRKVTLHTGETTFWKAFDQLCEKAGLVEPSGVPSPYYPAGPYGGPTPAPRPPIRIQPVPAPGVLPPAPPIKPPAGGLKGGAVIAPPVIAVQAVGAQVQIQIQQAQAQVGQAVPVQPGIAPPGRVRTVVPGIGGQLAVQAGTRKKLPTCYFGAVRIRAIPTPPGVRSPAGEKQVYLEITAEPGLRAFSVTDTPHLSRALDDQGQTLSTAAAATATGVPPGVVRGGLTISRVYNPYGISAGRQTFVLRLKAGEKQAKALKELTGTVTAQVLAPPQPLLKVEKVLKSAGKEVTGDSGGAMTVTSITKEDNGDYKVQVRLTDPPAGGVGGAVQFRQVQVVQGGVARIVMVPIRGGIGRTMSSPGSLLLLDAKGKAYLQKQASTHMTRLLFNGTRTQDMTLVFAPRAGQGEPASLVLSGQQITTVTIPFRLENVPLP
jgi:hypothetical protein